MNELLNRTSAISPADTFKIYLKVKIIQISLIDNLFYYLYLIKIRKA